MMPTQADSSENPKQPSVYAYTDYRAFLADWFEGEKQKKPAFSHRYLARLAGFGSQSYLKMVIDGERNLTTDTLSKVIRVLKLKRKEAQYFETLVDYTQAKEDKNKDYYFQKLLQLRPMQKFHQLEQDSFEYLTDKYLVIVREMTVLHQFKENPRWISQALGGKITPSRAAEIINILLRLGFLKRHAGGRLLPSLGTIKTPEGVFSVEMLAYHRAVLDDAKNAIINVARNRRELIAQTIAISEHMIPEIKQILQRCQDEIADYLNKQPASHLDNVFQINMQFFPATNIKDAK